MYTSYQMQIICINVIWWFEACAATRRPVKVSLPAVSGTSGNPLSITCNERRESQLRLFLTFSQIKDKTMDISYELLQYLM